ncbi:MAG: hypothetical protein ACI90V_012886 [Bacillariaceae sp.]
MHCQLIVMRERERVCCWFVESLERSRVTQDNGLMQNMVSFQD